MRSYSETGDTAQQTWQPLVVEANGIIERCVGRHNWLRGLFLRRWRLGADSDLNRLCEPQAAFVFW